VSALARSRWGDVDCELSRNTVRSPKTEHHEGKESRVIPLFAELLPQLEVVWNEAEDGAQFVITRYRGRNSNLRTQLERIIREAGFTPWPKLFQNLRSTRETELTEEFPIRNRAWTRIHLPFKKPPAPAALRRDILLAPQSCVDKVLTNFQFAARCSSLHPRRGRPPEV
jgi:hypothetical protein